MATYEVTKNEKEEFVIETKTEERDRTYHKQWLIDEIARLNNLLEQLK